MRAPSAQSTFFRFRQHLLCGQGFVESLPQGHLFTSSQRYLFVLVCPCWFCTVRGLFTARQQRKLAVILTVWSYCHTITIYTSWSFGSSDPRSFGSLGSVGPWSLESLVPSVLWVLWFLGSFVLWVLESFGSLVLWVPGYLGPLGPLGWCLCLCLSVGVGVGEVVDVGVCVWWRWWSLVVGLLFLSPMLSLHVGSLSFFLSSRSVGNFKMLRG